MAAELQEIFDDASGDLALGELEAAEGKYRQCIEADPEFADAHHALALTLSKLGRHAESIAPAQRYAELCPNEELAWSTLSLCHMKNHQIKEAEAARAKARILSWGGKIRKTEI
jgi:tetratricopeptide (TPR) repeat protein